MRSSGEVRREQQALDAGLPSFRLVVEGAVLGAEGLSQPRERARGAQHHAHRVPRPGDGVAEDVQPRLRIALVRRQHREDDAGRPEHDRQRARRGDADAERARRLVARRPDLGRLVCGRQPVERNVERRAHLVRPAPVRDVEEQRPRCVGGVDRPLAGEAEADVVLRQQDVPDPRVQLGLVPLQPQQLRRGEAGKRAVPGQLDEPLEADAALDLRALGAGALVVPEDRRPQHLVALAEHDEAVHLARESDRAFRQLGEHALRRLPPVFRILLRPAWLRRRERIVLLRRREHGAVLVDRDALDAGGADVEAEEDVGHAPRAA